MSSWLETNRSPIGLDVGSRRVKAVQLRKTPQGWRVEAASVLPRHRPNEPLGAEEAQWLREVLDRQGFVGTRLVTTAPAQGVATNVLELPPRTSGAPLDQIARMEMSRLQRRDPGEFEMALWDLPAPARSTGSHVMAAACSHEAADLLLDDLQNAGWQVLGFDIAPWAMARALNIWSAGASMTPVLDIGSNQSVFVLLHEAVVAYERKLPELGLAALFETLGKEHDLDDEGVEHWLTRIGLNSAGAADNADIAVRLDKNLVMTGLVERLRKELRASLSFAAHRYPEAIVKRVALLGGGAAIPGLAQRLAEGSDTEVAVVRLEDLVSCVPAIGATRGSTNLETALGLALYETVKIA